MFSRLSTYSAASVAKYFLAAGAGFAVDFLVFAALVGGGGSIYLANLGGFCVGATINVLLIRRYVFQQTRFKLGVDLAMTWVSNGAMLGVGMFALWALVDVVGINTYWAKFISNGLTFVLNYISRITIFRLK